MILAQKKGGPIISKKAKVKSQSGEISTQQRCPRRGSFYLLPFYFGLLAYISMLAALTPQLAAALQIESALPGMPPLGGTMSLDHSGSAAKRGQSISA
jgi:hypothetical protein